MIFLKTKRHVSNDKELEIPVGENHLTVGFDCSLKDFGKSSEIFVLTQKTKNLYETGGHTYPHPDLESISRNCKNLTVNH